MTADAETRFALERMSDPGGWERLAAAVLRLLEPRCATVIATGVNAEGKPVASPIDGIGFLPGTAHFVFEQHTTEARSGLRAKWLGADGDLVKAAAILSEERDRQSATEMTLFLTTNRVPDQKLVRDVRFSAEEAGMEVSILDVSRIASFLDDDPDGQWLRAKHLGIRQVRPSRGSLLDAGRASTDLFRRMIGGDSAAWIEREVEAVLLVRLARPGLTFLAMPSGSGKSTVCCRLLEKAAVGRRIGLWISEEAIIGSTTLRSAVNACIAGYAPWLSEPAGPLLGAPDQPPAVIVVDDVSRLPDPAAAIARLCAWGADLEADGGNAHVIVPVWPQFLARLPEALKRSLGDRVVAGEGFSDEEAAMATASALMNVGRPVSRLEAGDVAARLGNDPLLIGLWAATVVEYDPKHIVSDYIALGVRPPLRSRPSRRRIEGSCRSAGVEDDR